MGAMQRLIALDSIWQRPYLHPVHTFTLARSAEVIRKPGCNYGCCQMLSSAIKHCIAPIDTLRFPDGCIAWFNTESHW